jgi:hypothetical protein
MLELQLLKARRAQFGGSGEQLDRQITLVVGEPLNEQRVGVAVARGAADRGSKDRRVPQHLSREVRVHRPDATKPQHDATAGPAAAPHAAAGCAASARTSRSSVEIDRSTMAGWVAQCQALLDPLIAALGR